MNKTSSKYRRSWETNPSFRDWIQGVPGKPDKAFCRSCKCYLYAHRYSVLKHSCTMKHQANVSKDKIQNENSSSQQVLINYSKKDDQPNELISVINHNECTETSDMSNQQECHEESHLYEEIEHTTANDYENVCQVEDDCENYTVEPTEDVNRPVENSASNMSSTRPHISTHILDTTRGRTADNVPVYLYKLVNNSWVFIKQSTTNTDGRCADLITTDEFQSGQYKLHFDVSVYFSAIDVKTLYPYIEIAFHCETGEHYHIPLLLNPFGYTTYRGT